MKEKQEEPSYTYDREMDLIAEEAIDTEMLLDFIVQRQSIDWKAYVADCIAKGVSEELAYGFVNGILRALDEFVEFLIQQGALREVPSNEA